MENECVIICREINKDLGTISSYKCKQGTYDNLSKDFDYIITRSMFNQELRYFICTKDNLEKALYEVSKPHFRVTRYCVEIKR